MTESPINLDEAHRMIGQYRARKAKYPGIDQFKNYIDMAYLESIVNELEAGRERIAELERKIESTRKAQLQEVIDNDHAIIPQAEDAQILKHIYSLMHGMTQYDAGDALIHRYLAAIEGGKQ